MVDVGEVENLNLGHLLKLAVGVGICLFHFVINVVAGKRNQLAFIEKEILCIRIAAAIRDLPSVLTLSASETPVTCS